MRFNDLWLVHDVTNHYCTLAITHHRYDVFFVSTPILWYNITINLLQLEVSRSGGNSSNSSNVELGWNHVSTIHLSPATTLGRSEDGRVNDVA